MHWQEQLGQYRGALSDAAWQACHSTHGCSVAEVALNCAKLRPRAAQLVEQLVEMTHSPGTRSERRSAAGVAVSAWAQCLQSSAQLRQTAFTSSPVGEAPDGDDTLPRGLALSDEAGQVCRSAHGRGVSKVALNFAKLRP